MSKSEIKGLILNEKCKEGGWLFNYKKCNKLLQEILLKNTPQWPKCVDKSDFVGKARNSYFCNQNM